MRTSNETGDSAALRRVRMLLDEERCVVLDGGVATELQRTLEEPIPTGEELWGTWALLRAPDGVRDVHSRYVGSGCDVISTNMWSILTAPEQFRLGRPGGTDHWMDAARLRIRLAREAVADAGRNRAVAFAFAGDVDSQEKLRTVDLLSRVFETER